jgi:hypothetical protein
MKRKIQVLIDNQWVLIDRAQELPPPPAPKRGYRERFVDDQWVFIKNPLKIKF